VTKRFYRWLRDPNDEEHLPEVRWIKAASSKNHKLLPEELLTESDVAGLLKAANEYFKSNMCLTASSTERNRLQRFGRS